MTNKLLILFLLLILFGGGYFVWQQISQPAATYSTSSQTPQPDFKVNKIAFSQDGHLLVTVQNVGGNVTSGKLHMTVDATTLVRSPSGDYQSQKIPNHIFDGDVASPSAGMSQTYTLKVANSAFEVGIHDMTVVLNSNGAISESNTQNNTYTDMPTMPVIPHEGE